MPTKKKQLSAKKLIKPKAKTSAKKTSAKVTLKKKLSLPTKTSARTTTHRPVKKVVTRKKVVKKPVLKTKSTTQTVTLPTNATEKSIEKSKDLRSALDIYINKSAYIVAYVSAICFILVGSAVISTDLFSQNKVASIQRAQVISTTQTADATISQYQQPPKVAFLTEIPDNVVSELRINFLAQNVEKVAINLVPANANGGISLQFDTLLDGKFKSKIPANVSPGYYRLKIFYYALDGSGFAGIVSKKFFIGSEEVEKMLTDLASKTNEETAPLVDVVQDKETLEIESGQIESEHQKISSSTDTSVRESSSLTNDFALFVNSSNDLSKLATIGVTGAGEYSFVELYARPLNSLREQFVALATKRFNQWIFHFDTANLPNGAYELTAKSSTDGKLVESKTLTVAIRNPIETRDNVEVGDSTTSTDENERPQREFVKISDSDFEPSFLTTSDVKNVSKRLLLESSDEINKLLEHHALAVQTGDQVLIETTNIDLNKKRQSIIASALQDSDLKSIADDLDKEIEQQIITLRKKVATFESIRNDRSNAETSIDTDGDGISDFDEVNIYLTDPHSPDTDNDGVNDGVEIVRGYNPVDSSDEAVIIFESPREVVGLERRSVLEIQSVTPLIETVNSEISVQAEIRGKALPNSFVTLYIFSLPTVVTVRTDADGSFVYTFDRELEDGEHDVYVAVTDNTGSIIVQSSPFSFIKTAQAFSPVGVEESQVSTTFVTQDQSKNSYNTVLGLAVLSLGIILLMLGIGLRTSQPQTKTAVKSTKQSEDPPSTDLSDNIVADDNDSSNP